MAEPSSLLGTINRASRPVAFAFIAAASVSVLGYYAGVPGLSALSGEHIGLLIFGVLLAAFVLIAKRWEARPKVEKVKKRFRDLSDEQRNYLVSVRTQPRAFKGWPDSQLWFKELLSLGYLEYSRPFFLFPGEPFFYDVTEQGLCELAKEEKRAARAASA